jgi:hypothetical protein
MSTRAMVHFHDGEISDEPASRIYVHCDGYPSGLGKEFAEFFLAVREQCGRDTRFDDAEYLAAKFLVWKAGRYARNGQPLNFLSLGISDAKDHGDICYRYHIVCKDQEADPAVFVDTDTDNPNHLPLSEALLAESE